ncbi:MAG TPA: GPW/gp25 family protein [Verrucomicrobiae bacterium]|nr:GPW/gp25 family protein [Verrucomicrobiae bacterium]
MIGREIGRLDDTGSGLSFPPRIGAGGRLVWSSDEDNIRESIRVILLTEPGERLMREDFGCALRTFLFEPNTPTTRALIRDRIERAIARWERRVRVDDVRVEADPADDRLIQIAIEFRQVATGSAGRLGLSLQREV